MPVHIYTYIYIYIYKYLYIYIYSYIGDARVKILVHIPSVEDIKEYFMTEVGIDKENIEGKNEAQLVVQYIFAKKLQSENQLANRSLNAGIRNKVKEILLLQQY